MNILGILVIILMPYALGTILNAIMKQKETSQIETYLIGFFSLFLVQGLVFMPTNLRGVSFQTTSAIFTYITIGVMVVFPFVYFFTLKNSIIPKLKNPHLEKYEWIMVGLMALAILALVLRVFLLFDYLRDDAMLATIRVNMNTGTINEFNPMTNRMYELGLITSKKLVTLSTYYTYLASQYGIEPRVLLYLVITLQTLMCVYFTYTTMAIAVIKNNRYKIFTLLFFLTMLLLSGDYFSGALGYRLLWNGYSGDIIVAAIMIAYIMNVIMSYYRLQRGDYGEVKLIDKLVHLFKILLCVAASIYITSIATGILMLFVSMAASMACSLLRFNREEKAS